MTSIKGIYENGQVTLVEPIPGTGPLEVVVLYDETNVSPGVQTALSFPTYDVPLPDSTESFSRDILY